MKKFAILTDSCSDLDRENRARFDVDYLPMRMLFNERDLPADLDWADVSFGEFYRMMRDGIRIRTAQINAMEYAEAFESYVAKGADILSISCSSALSSSFKGSLVARDKVLAKHPDAKIFCIDSRISSLGQGMLCKAASLLRGQGKSIEEVAEYIEKNKQRVKQFATVENLVYLKRAGRVSAASAVFGGLLQIKPIIVSDEKGENVAVEKVKGRKNSLGRIADLVQGAYEKDPLYGICIGHADCEQDALALRSLIAERLPGAEITVDKIGPIIGASSGPGMLSAYCYAKE